VDFVNEFVAVLKSHQAFETPSLLAEENDVKDAENQVSTYMTQWQKDSKQSTRR
jgi:hypothetical protein